MSAIDLQLLKAAKTTARASVWTAVGIWAMLLGSVAISVLSMIAVSTATSRATQEMLRRDSQQNQRIIRQE